MALKLHRTLAHASAEKIYQLLKESGRADTELKEEIVKVVKKCEVCQKIRRPPNRPKVCLP